ncbi:MAG: BtaA family protein [Xanthomonadales bacterium]|nr:BtaA family protein [Xanthomonadales bacterium]
MAESGTAPSSRITLKQRAYDAWFRHTHQSRLIYNTCWEDPRADRAMLRLDSASEIAMITSAGCNALDYLLDDPAAIHCVDMNPRQNALLDLKLAALRSLAHDDLFKLFGLGRHAQIDLIYRDQLRAQLLPESASFWDRNLHWFNGRGRGSFYFRGASGDVAWLVRGLLKLTRPGLRRDLIELLDAPDLATQRELYQRVEGRLFGPLVRLLIRQPATLTLLGVPRAQRDLIAQQYPGGVTAFVQDKLRWLMTELPVSENYFWRLYLHGEYSAQCCPNYLRPENRAFLRERLDRVHLYTASFSDFLQRHQRPLSHFVLLDHQDWLVAHDVDGLEQEWRLILQRSTPGARVLLRSAAPEVGFLPGFVQRAIRDQADQQHWHQRDRVGTYGSMMLAEVAA